MVPVRKFSMRTSDDPTRALTTSTASGALMTAAPRSARRAPHQGPAMTRERSRTRTPSRARGKGAMPATIPRPVLHSSGSKIFNQARRTAMARAWFWVVAAALGGFGGGGAGGGKASGTVTIESKSVALGVGVSWGDGKLHYKDKTHAFSVRGVSVVDVGVSKVSAR